MRILNDKNKEISKEDIANLQGAPVPPELSARERKRQLMQPLFDRLKKLGIAGESQARNWCEGALSHKLAKLADITEEEIPVLVEVAKKSLGEPSDVSAPSVNFACDTRTAIWNGATASTSDSPAELPKEEKRMCGTNGCANTPDKSGFCEECVRARTFDELVKFPEPDPLATSVVPDVVQSAPVTRSDSEIAHLESILNSEDGTPVRILPDGSVVPDVVQSELQDASDKPDARPSLEVAIGSHASITTGRLAPFITRLRAWNMRKLPPERRKRFRDCVTEVEMAWDNLRQELQALAAEGFVAKTSPSTRMAATLRTGDGVSLDESQLALFGEVYSQEELANLKVDAVTDTHAAISAPTRSLGLVKLCHLAKK